MKIRAAFKAIKESRIYKIILALSAIVIGVSAFTGGIENLLIQVKGLFFPANIELKASVYLYERAYIFEGPFKLYFSQMRNLASNCSLWKVNYPKFLRGRAITPDPAAWIILKLFIENSSNLELSNLRFGLVGLPMRFNEIEYTPNIQASLNYKTISNEGLGSHIVNITSLAPRDKAVLSLKKLVDKIEYLDIAKRKKISISVPFISADQLKVSKPEVNKLNAMEMVKREAEIFTGVRTFANEKIQFRLLCESEPDIIENDMKDKLLPSARVCPEGTGGEW
ncbi:MAG: hypothetical protein ACOZF0_02070 [Thermodesulfobacteriota bacterium]